MNALKKIHFVLLGMVLACAAPLPEREAQATAATNFPRTCFTPDQDCETEIVNFVKSAKTKLDIAAFDLTLDQLVHHILVQQKKKILVRVVVDRRQSRGQNSLVSTLIKGGVPVRIGVQRGLMHHKFIIVDDKELETGSFNFTHGAANKNQENQIYLNDSKVVQAYSKQFERVWGKAKPAKLESL